MERKKPTRHPTPFSALVGTPAAELLEMMHEHTLRQIPLVDEDGRVVDLAVLQDLAKEAALPVRAVVMAGGLGTRLRPLTDDLPKPMLPIGERPLLEHVIEQLREAGIRRLNLTTHFKRDVISDHFGSGDDFGIEISYVEEGEPLAGHLEEALE